MRRAARRSAIRYRHVGAQVNLAMSIPMEIILFVVLITIVAWMDVKATTINSTFNKPSNDDAQACTCHLSRSKEI